LAVTLALAACTTRRDPLPGFPRLMLWAWERPEHLTFIDPHSTGVAFLARSIQWREGKIASRPRYQPVEVPADTVMMAVTRLDSISPPLPDAGSIANEIAATASLPRVLAIQVDFDAALSERAWYADLLRLVRRRLDPSMPLTVTALASWCRRDPWIRVLPVRDAVPMLFRMGPGEPRGALDFSLAVCQSSLGISTDEMPVSLPHGRRLFVFHPRPWTADAYRAAMQIARRFE
jgi:hypothetical protein